MEKILVFIRDLKYKVVFTIYFGSADTLFAQTYFAPPAPPGGRTIFEFVIDLIGAFLKVTIGTLVFYFVYRAFRIVTASGSGDENALTEAKHKFLWAFIIMVVALGLGLIALVIRNTTLTIAPDFPCLFCR